MRIAAVDRLLRVARGALAQLRDVRAGRERLVAGPGQHEYATGAGCSRSAGRSHCAARARSGSRARRRRGARSGHGELRTWGEDLAQDRARTNCAADSAAERLFPMLPQDFLAGIDLPDPQGMEVRLRHTTVCSTSRSAGCWTPAAGSVSCSPRTGKPPLTGRPCSRSPRKARSPTAAAGHRPAVRCPAGGNHRGCSCYRNTRVSTTTSCTGSCSTTWCTFATPPVQPATNQRRLAAVLDHGEPPFHTEIEGHPHLAAMAPEAAMELAA